ncbi:amidohydrolase family protein [Roseicyclus elongatus]|uniref:hypothetical protein n=1 Tax=Roseicyclus elongatus TaxID=159346 RepID=UPI0004AEEC2C
MTGQCLTFDKARVLTPEGVGIASLSIAGGVITQAPQARRIDLSGYLVLPGIVDLHGDGFERHVAPRRGLVGDLGPGLRGLEAELAANGITTAVLAQYWSWGGGDARTCLRETSGRGAEDAQGTRRADLSAAP